MTDPISWGYKQPRLKLPVPLWSTALNLRLGAQIAFVEIRSIHANDTLPTVDVAIACHRSADQAIINLRADFILLHWCLPSYS